MKNPQDVRAHLRIFLMNGADLVNSNVKNRAKVGIMVKLTCITNL